MTNMFYNAFSQLQYTILALTVIWLDESIKYCEIFPDFCNIFRKDRNFTDLNDNLSVNGESQTKAQQSKLIIFEKKKHLKSSCT